VTGSPIVTRFRVDSGARYQAATALALIAHVRKLRVDLERTLDVNPMDTRDLWVRHRDSREVYVREMTRTRRNVARAVRELGLEAEFEQVKDWCHDLPLDEGLMEAAEWAAQVLRDAGIDWETL
jgi:hypothetical protein